MSSHEARAARPLPRAATPSRFIRRVALLLLLLLHAPVAAPTTGADAYHSLFVRVYDGAGLTQVKGVTWDKYDNFYGVGKSYGPSTTFGEGAAFVETRTGTASIDAFAFKVSAAGTVLWTARAPTAVVGGWSEFLAADTDHKNERIIIGGVFTSNTANPGGATFFGTPLTSAGWADAVLMKVDFDGNLDWILHAKDKGGTKIFDVDADQVTGAVYAAGFSEAKTGNPGTFGGLVYELPKTEWGR